MSMNPRLPAPAYGYGRKRTESRRIEGPGRSQYVITHRHGSEYQKQSVFASVKPQTAPPLLHSHGHHGHSPGLDQPGYPNHPRVLEQHGDFHPRLGPGHHDLPRVFERYRHPPEFAEAIRFGRKSPRETKHRKMPISSPSTVSSRDDSDMDQRSPRGLTFGISLARSNSDKNSSVSLTQASETSLGHNGVKGSKNNIEGDYKVYKETIFSVSSSRYTNSLDLAMPVEAELVLQPPPRPTERSLNPLLTWM